MDDIPLKACPLCGGVAVTWYDEHERRVQCGVPAYNCPLTKFSMSVDQWQNRPTVTHADGDAERALEALDALTGFHGTLYYKQLGQWVIDYISTIRTALQTRKLPAKIIRKNWAALGIKDQLIEQQGNMCACCSKIMKPGRRKDLASIEHVIPLSGGGLDEESNLVITCIGCNEAGAYQACLTPPVPVDTISIKREGLQGVRDKLETAMSLLVRKQPEYMVAHHVRDAIKMIASLDAVLKEGE